MIYSQLTVVSSSQQHFLDHTGILKPFVEAGHLQPPLPRRLLTAEMASTKVPAVNDKAAIDTAAAPSNDKASATTDLQDKPLAVFTLRGTGALLDGNSEGNGIAVSSTKIKDVSKLGESGMAGTVIAASDEKAAVQLDASAEPPTKLASTLEASTSAKEDVPSSFDVRTASQKSVPASSAPLPSSYLKAKSPDHVASYTKRNVPEEYYTGDEYGYHEESYVPKEVNKEKNRNVALTTDKVCFGSYVILMLIYHLILIGMFSLPPLFCYFHCRQ